MGETRVDLLHLLEDLRDAYPGSLEETILTEIVANALDSGADVLRIGRDPQAATLLAADDGSGMSREALRRYHDLATTTKRRGRGIGFAGVGIKLGLLACSEVITETRHRARLAATSWHLANRTRAPWTWIAPPHLLDGDAQGTAILLRLSNPLSQLLDAGFLEMTVLRNFQPLFEPEFLEILHESYPAGLSIILDGSVVVGPIRPALRSHFSIRVGRQRKPSGMGYLARHDESLPEPERGLAISTLGKVIRRGWDWVGLTPADPDRIEGLVEVPALADALTLNKGDFLRTGRRGALYLAYRKAIQEAVAQQLSAWGATPPPPRRSPRTRPIERDLRRVLGELAEEFPVLATLAERRMGGQRKLPLGDAAGDHKLGEWPTSPDPAQGSDLASGSPGSSREPTPGNGEAHPGGIAPSRDPKAGEREEGTHPFPVVRPPAASGRKRSATLSLEIRFESLPGDVTLGRLIESTVWVNDAHPAYRRAVASRAEGYHLALTVASALAPLAVEAPQAQGFIHRFLARWGEAAEDQKQGPR